MSSEVIRKVAQSPGGVALATVVAVEGSAPGRMGARMLVRADGSTVGTVGGGRVEAGTIELARQCIAERRSSTLRVELTGNSALGSTLICGGSVAVAVDFVADTAPFKAAAKVLEHGQPVVLVRPGGSGVDAARGQAAVAVLGWDGAILWGEGRQCDAAVVTAALDSGVPLVSEADGLLYDPVAPQEGLLILGAGHVGLALARLAVDLDFHVTVGDPRPDFTNAGRFPDGVETVCDEFSHIVEGYPFGPTTSIVIVCPDHLGDIECVRAILPREYRYAGFIGSRRKVAMILAQVKAEGFDPAKADALSAPIGIDIGAETPAEIAVCILAEIIATRRRSPALARFAEERARRRG